MRKALVLLFLFASSYALIVGPAIYEQDDFGDISLLEFTYSLSADCSAGTITTIVMDESNKPVQDANAYLQYIDFATPLISSGKTDKDGYVLSRLPGSVQLMRGLFILVVEKKGFRSKEVHFDLYPCLHNGSLPPKPPPPKPPEVKPPPVMNYTVERHPANISNITVPKPPPANASGSANNSTNGTGGNGGGEGERTCPVPLALISGMVAYGMFIKFKFLK